MENSEELTHKFYDENASQFSSTRYIAWPLTQKFLENNRGLILDSGCGNGRSILKPNTICLDYSLPLLKEAQKLKNKLNPICFRGDIFLLPYKNSTFDTILSVAVIHHLNSDERRLKAVQEMFRVMKNGGKALIYVWNKNISYKKKFQKIENDDYYVSWKNNFENKRYYHLFSENELETLLRKGGFKILEIGNEQESIFAIVEK